MLILLQPPAIAGIFSRFQQTGNSKVRALLYFPRGRLGRRPSPAPMGHLRVEPRLMSMVALKLQIQQAAISPLRHSSALSFRECQQTFQAGGTGRGVAVAAWALGAGETHSMSGPARSQTGLEAGEDCRTPLQLGCLWLALCFIFFFLTE